MVGEEYLSQTSIMNDSLIDAVKGYLSVIVGLKSRRNFICGKARLIGDSHGAVLSRQNLVRRSAGVKEATRAEKVLIMKQEEAHQN